MVCVINRGIVELNEEARIYRQSLRRQLDPILRGEKLPTTLEYMGEAIKVETMSGAAEAMLARHYSQYLRRKLKSYERILNIRRLLAQIAVIASNEQEQLKNFAVYGQDLPVRLAILVLCLLNKQIENAIVHNATNKQQTSSQHDQQD